MAASQAQLVEAFVRGHVVSVQRQVAAAAFAATLDFKEAARLSNVSARRIADWAVNDQAFIEAVAALMKRRMERLAVSGDELVVQLQEIAKEARAKGQHKDAISALRTIAEMSGLLGGRVLNATQNKTVNYNFGSRPALPEDVIEVEPE